jgi:YbbR domain-containing protein
MLFSLLAAVALWMYVEISFNQEKTYPVQDVPIVFRNKEVLTDRGLLISSYSPQTVSLEFDCPPSVAARLTSQTLSVEIDLGVVTIAGTRPLHYDIIYPPDVDRGSISAERRFVDRVSIVVDRLLDWPVQVKVDYRGGTASDDLIADAEIYDPQTIIVSGPEDVVTKIKSAFVPIPRERLSSTYSEDLGFILLDENEEELDEKILSSVTHNPETVHVIIPVRQMKDVPLSIELMYGAGATDQNTNIICEPSYINVAGDPDAIRDFNIITLRTLDITRYRDMVTTEVFPIIVPNHLTNLSGETEATVTVEVLGLEIDYYSTSNLHVINTPDDYRAEMRSQNLEVWIRGRREDLDQISLENIRVVADLTDMKPGTSRVPAKVYLDGTDANIGAVGEYRITVTLISEMN